MRNVKGKTFFNKKELAILAELPEQCYSAGKRKLCGSARRRYLYHRKHKKDVEEAYELACKPMKHTLSQGQMDSREKRFNKMQNIDRRKQIKFVKEGHAVDAVVPSKAHQKAQNSKYKATSSNFEQTRRTPTGIINTEHPHSMLTSAQMNVIQKAILDAIPLAAKDRINPRFENVRIRSGWLLLTCLTESTFKWVEKLVKTIQLEDNTKVKAVREEDIPRLQIVTGIFPAGEEESSQNILVQLNHQNPTLKAIKWKIVSRDQDGTDTKISFSIDKSSMENLIIAGYRVRYKFSHIILQLKVL